tara:strand:- start:13017 stop:13463 length:447 start_codon:yes stop_codon:yes gene_type:complete
MKVLKRFVNHEWTKALESNQPIALPKLAQTIINNSTEEISGAVNELIFNAVLKILKETANATIDNSGQMELFGFPSVIAIPNETGYVYLRSTAATYQQLVAGKTIREKNVSRAQTKLDYYRGALEKVQPVMEGTDLILVDALQKIASK